MVSLKVLSLGIGRRYYHFILFTFSQYTIIMQTISVFTILLFSNEISAARQAVVNAQNNLVWVVLFFTLLATIIVQGFRLYEWLIGNRRNRKF